MITTNTPSHLRGRISWWLLPALCAALWLLPWKAVRGAEVDPRSDISVRQAVRQAAELAYPGTAADRLSMSDRFDLTERASKLNDGIPQAVSFYSLDDSDLPPDDDSIWAVVAAKSRAGSHEIYSFESSDSIEESAKTFNQLVSQLSLSVPDNKAVTIAQFFLDCCVRTEPGETASSEHELEHLVERFYIGVYGDVWRALESGTQWWSAYQKSAADLQPRVVVASGVRRVILERLMLGFGMHPQLQQWEIAVAPDGSVRVLGVDAVFPKQRRWLSYSPSLLGSPAP